MAPSLLRLRRMLRKWRVRFKKKAAPSEPLPPPGVPFAVSPLGKLPSELRNIIYELVLLTDEETTYYGREAPSPHWTIEPSLNTAEPGIMQTCHQIRNETLSIYYSRSFTVAVPWISVVDDPVPCAHVYHHLKAKSRVSLQMVKRLTIHVQGSRPRMHCFTCWGNWPGRRPHRPCRMTPLESVLFLLVERGFGIDRLHAAIAYGFPLRESKTRDQIQLEKYMFEKFEEFTLRFSKVRVKPLRELLLTDFEWTVHHFPREQSYWARHQTYWERASVSGSF